jgi:hypothetical protein
MQKALASASPTRYRIFMKRLGEGIRGLIGASGGIGYHLAALRYASRLWNPFREDLARELADRIPAPEETDLVLVGPSGGYCFDPAFFRRFRSILAVDLDPLAGPILRERVAGVRFIRQDFFRELESAGWDLARWANGIQAPSSATILFANLLGQLGFLFGESRVAEIEAGLSRALRSERKWISFHDRFSVRVGPAPRVFLEYALRPTSRDLAEAWTAKWPIPAGEIFEHEIGGWIEAARSSYRYFPWRLDARRTQLIEVCGNR